MDDLISRQAAKDAINRKYRMRKDSVIATINRLPAADARENVRGEWKEIAERGLCDLRRCSNCGHIEAVGLEMITPKPNFCPNCGADMRGEQE